MRNFVLKIEFSADDDNANAVLERIADAFNGIVDAFLEEIAPWGSSS